MTQLEPDAFARFITELGYDPANAKQLPDGFYLCVKPLMFHWTLLVGEQGDQMSWLDNWCFASQDTALAAMQAWDGQGDAPDGWHRHPKTGRRRPDGDRAAEHVRF